MQLKFLNTLVPAQDGAAKISALAWSPNNTKLAVCTADRVILLFDEQGEKKDKFSTKPVDAKYGKKSYLVKGLAFSPDSTKLAVGQTDCILFVYKIGESWSDKKVICNKFLQKSPITCLIWPSDIGIVFGCLDGKLRLANVKTNKSSTLYGTGVCVISLASSSNKKAFLSGHADGSIVAYSFDGQTQAKVCTHPSPPYALVWTDHSVVAAGCDKRIISYNRNGRILQQFDYSRDDQEKEFTTAVVNPSGQSVVIGSFDRLRVFNLNSRRGGWEEGKTKEIQYLYTITALEWKPDGSRIVCGTLCGSVQMFDCCLKRSMIKNKFETTYVGPSQVIVKNIATNQRVIAKSEFGYEIDDVKVLGKDRYVVAQTSNSLIFGDLESGKTSEVPWQATGNEKYYFENENVCMIFNAGELSLIEYGNNEVLASVRTEFMNPLLISVRLNERQYKNSNDIKRMAFLVDLKTISIMDLVFGTNIGQISHDSKIDWLEWVPMSDVIVAQNRENLCVWYNVDTPDRTTMFPIKGDVMDLVREEGQTNVLVAEGIQQVAYTLDENLIEFGTAMDDVDLKRAVTYLEELEIGPDTEAMWRQLANVALQHTHLHVAQRAYAALGDVARVRFLDETRRLAREAAKQLGGDGTQNYKVRARLAIMSKDFKEAERIYLEQNSLDEALEMYQSLQKWQEALDLAQARAHPDVENLKAKFYRHLAETGQDEKGGEIKEKEGDHMAAIDLYLKGNLPARAARVLVENEQYLTNTELVQSVAVALIKRELFDRAGELFEKTKDFERALECYRRGKAFNRAVELSRYAFPGEVIKLEEEWGDMLSQEKQMDAAINHYIESGNTLKALEAAVKARQWNKAVQIVEVVENPDMAKDYYGKIAEHYSSIQEYDRAERFYIEAGMHREAIDMYNAAGKWSEAHRLASEFMKADETSEMYLTQAQQLEDQGRLKEAEQLYCAVNQSNKAIAMYKNAGQYEPMMRLVQQYHGEHIQDTHVHLAKELEEQSRFREAEKHYLDAGEWKSAVNMYRAAEQWEDAYRVAKQAGGETAPKQIAYLWAKSLGGDSAVKLLQKFGLLEEAIDYASDNGAFDFAFELCRLGMKPKMPSVHLKYALQLEEDGQTAQAEEQFLQAGKPKEVVLMYIHQQDWDNAQRLAEKHCPEAIDEVYIGQARIAFEQQDYSRAESYLLRAQKPEIIIKTYKEMSMWSDALRVCKEYLPNLLPKLQDEFDTQQLKSGAKGAQSYVAQAKDWETQGEYDRAIGCYLKVTRPLTQDEMLMEKCWTKAGELAAKFLPDEPASEAVQRAAGLLQEIGRFTAAAEMLLTVGLAREAVDTFIAAGEWNKAKKVAVELQPELEAYVDGKYKDFLKNEGKAEQLADVDVLSAIDMYIERGQWDKALDTAKQQSNGPLLDKYVALYATELIGNRDFTKAVGIFEKYGASANRQNFNIYKRLIDEIIGVCGTNTPDSYELWSGLRNVLLSLVTNIETSKEDLDPRYMEIFNRYLVLCHCYSLRSALMKVAGTDSAIKLCATKLSVSLLRHTDLIPADKAFYEAGTACKEYGSQYESMAFVFLNHYLDLAEAIEEQNADAVDYSDFEGTDIPTEIPLPEQLHLTPELHEEVKEWVLAVSVDKQIERKLLKDKRGIYEASLINSNASLAEPCIVTGYPVLDSPKSFGNSGKMANKDDWNKLLMVQKMSSERAIDDVQKFLSSWTKTTISMAL